MTRLLGLGRQGGPPRCARSDAYPPGLPPWPSRLGARRDALGADRSQGRPGARREIEERPGFPHPIRGPELRALRELRRDYPETPYLFVTERGGPMTPATARKLIARAGELSKFSFPIHPHMLRHYVARPTISAQKANASCFLGNWAVRGVGPQLITRHSF